MLYLSTLAADPQAPPDDSVVAGSWGFLILILLIAFVAFLGWSLVRQFRKMDRAAAEGVYGEVEPEASETLETMESTAATESAVTDASEQS